LIGHASIAEQLHWCAEAGIRRAIFTHCGSPIVRGNARKLNAQVRQLGRQQGIDASVACDNDKLDFVRKEDDKRKTKAGAWPHR
jgi:hypothetical protein